MLRWMQVSFWAWCKIFCQPNENLYNSVHSLCKLSNFLFIPVLLSSLLLECHQWQSGSLPSLTFSPSFPSFHHFSFLEAARVAFIKIKLWLSEYDTTTTVVIYILLTKKWLKTFSTFRQNKVLLLQGVWYYMEYNIMPSLVNQGPTGGIAQIQW